MSYSDYDSDGYSSNEDADYVPSDDNLSEDDMNECVKEEGLEGGEASDDITKRKGKKKKGKELGVRKRKKGGLKLEEGEEAGLAEEEGESQEEGVGHPAARANQEPEEDKQQKKSDDLWASFLSDVGSKPKPPVAAIQSSNILKASPSEEKQPTATSEGLKRPELKAPEVASKVTITKVFDFAGEEVRVTKEVSADSKEARSFLKAQESETSPEEDTPPSRLLPGPPAPGPSAKRPVGMGSILNRLGAKKQKMSTLEKSKMDWDSFKTEEGIGDELAIHNRGKEGYVERKNFLERVDQRQFEQEKKVRLGNMKR
ncbi:craniofacial development protein 1 [Osmerus mordax]|uniref:craniofacial development protein 1 n=1 Tax=Osmerus mordax TaxID=8014 RepID=UPI00350EAA38